MKIRRFSIINNIRDKLVIKFSTFIKKVNQQTIFHHDYDSFKQKLLIPLGPEGNLHYQINSLDMATDEYVNSEIKTADRDTIFIIDGTFLLKRIYIS